MPAPVSLLESQVPERFYLGIAASGPGRARRAAPLRDRGDDREDDPPTGLVAPAFDDSMMSYHRNGDVGGKLPYFKIFYRFKRYSIFQMSR